MGRDKKGREEIEIAEESMRLDKFLKLSRLLKRRTIAKEACAKGYIRCNGRVAKPSTRVNLGDTIQLEFARKCLEIEIQRMPQRGRKNQDTYRIAREIWKIE